MRSLIFICSPHPWNRDRSHGFDVDRNGPTDRISFADLGKCAGLEIDLRETG
jgi:hypothetical protein